MCEKPENSPTYFSYKNRAKYIAEAEEEIRRTPSVTDLKHTVSLLKDFDIHINVGDIPPMQSNGALERWRLAQIKEKLYG